MAEQVSVFKPFSIGQVTKPKTRTSRHIQVLALETASATDGEVTHAPLEQIFKGVNADGSEYQVKSVSTRDMECEWFPGETNQVTPPDVERGELVMIYRLADTAQYFWTTMGLRNHLRTLESVIILYGATPDVSGCGLDFTKCYYQQWSPLDGHITFGTSQANGEQFKYTVQINTKQSFVAITDDVGNFMEVNSADSRVQLHNVDNSFFKAEKKIVDINADMEINLTCGSTKINMKPDSIKTTTKTYEDSATDHTTKATNINRQGTNITDKSTAYVNNAATWTFA